MSSPSSRAREYRRLKKSIVPALLFNQDLYERVLHRYVSSKAVWLDAGCGHKILPSWRLDAEQELVARAQFALGCDGDLKAIHTHSSMAHRVGCDLAALPLKPETFTLITSNMVVEHIEDPRHVFAEFARILKPGGVVIVHTPNRWSYASILAALIPEIVKNRIIVKLGDRPAEDYYPVRYRCNTPKKLRQTFHDVGMQEIQLSMYASDAVFQVLARSWLGRLILRIELYVLKLSLQPRWRFLRLSICGVYKKAV